MSDNFAKSNVPAYSDNDWITDEETVQNQFDQTCPVEKPKSQEQNQQIGDRKSFGQTSKQEYVDDWDVDEINSLPVKVANTATKSTNQTNVDEWSDDQLEQDQKTVQIDEFKKENLINKPEFNEFKVPDPPKNDQKDIEPRSNYRNKKPFRNNNNKNNNNFTYQRGGTRNRFNNYYRNYYNHHNSFSSNASVSGNSGNEQGSSKPGNEQGSSKSGNEQGSSKPGNEQGSSKPYRKIDGRYNRSLNSNFRNQDANPLNDEKIKQLNDASNLTDEEIKEQIEDLNEELEQKSNRKQIIERNLHNQKTYYDQRNNVESDEMSDIQSDFDSKDKHVSLDTKMKELVKLLIESFVPFNILHGSYFSNLLRSRFSIRKMPKLVQMRGSIFSCLISKLLFKIVVFKNLQIFSWSCTNWDTDTFPRHSVVQLRTLYALNSGRQQIDVINS